MNQTPTKNQYVSAKETVEKYEERQKQLNALKEELSKKLDQFETINFKINKKNKEIIFAGVLNNKIKIGKTVCGMNDKYEDVIGKLIAVKKSLCEDISEIIKYVESNNTCITIDSRGLTLSGINSITYR